MNHVIATETTVEWNAIIQRAQRFDPAAFDVIVDAYAGRLCGFFRRLLGRCNDAEDLVQEVFVRVVRMIPQYQDDGRFEAWLFRIATNLARDRIRERDRRPRVVGLDDVSLGDASEISDIKSEISKKTVGRGFDGDEATERLAQAMDRLPVAEREVILLRHYGHLTFEEIAEMMGTPLGTALARGHRGLGKLREWMGASP
ncbi:MAG: sigma-70 family RNA polymerase sigma factor [Phycisphaerales bacterium]|nr:sigma-70 family RNA polymerase sigma factor [Phycisphaerales bacterium]